MRWRLTEDQLAMRASRMPRAYQRPSAEFAPISTTPPLLAKARPRKRAMNKTERAYAQILADRQKLGEIVWFEYEAITFKLADDTRYTPDFAVQLASNEFELHETKGGFIRDDAWVKLKVAARLFPFRFLKCVQRPKKEGGGFILTEVPA